MTKLLPPTDARDPSPQASYTAGTSPAARGSDAAGAFHSAIRLDRGPDASGFAAQAAWSSPDILPGAAVPGLFSWDVTLTLPWPPRAVHQNGRPNRYAKAAATKAYRRTCADAAHNSGVSPMEKWTIAAITFCPPNARKRDLDGMIGAFKAGQDGLADAAGADDATFDPKYHRGAPCAGGAVIVTMRPITIPG